MSPKEQGAARIFISYCRKDEPFLYELQTHLKLLKREGLVQTWHDRLIDPGANWEKEIDHQLESASVILLLVSPDFLASEYCWGKEVARALERHASGQALVVPIIVRICDWKSTDLSTLQVLPKDGLPVRRWSDSDEAYLDILSSLRRMLVQSLAKYEQSAADSEAPKSRPAPARSADPPRGVRFRLELGMHGASISRIAVDAAGSFLVTGSEDKTARVWSLRDGRLLRILRPPIGSGHEGKIFAVAISPDARWIAAGVWSECHSIYLFECKSGKFDRRLGPLPSAVQHLAFNSQGTRLAVSLIGAVGLKVLEMETGKELFAANNLSDRNNWATYLPGDQLVTSSQDGFLRLYDADHQLLIRRKAPGRRKPFCIASASNFGEIAVSYHNNSRIDILATTSLQTLCSLDLNRGKARCIRLAWSHDGERLYAGFRSPPGSQLIRSWAARGRGDAVDLPGPKDVISGLATLKKGRVVYGAADPAWAMIGANGKVLLAKLPPKADFDNLTDAFYLDATGRSVGFSFDRVRQRLGLLSLTERQLHLGPAPKNFHLPILRSPGIKVTNWKDSEPSLNGEKIKLDYFESSTCLAIASDGRSFLLGSGWWLRLFNFDGRKVWQIGIPDAAMALNLTRDGRLALAAFGDGTIRWFRASDGEELLAFFPHIDGKRWVLWTPSGYYDASPGGEELFGWHVNRGPDQAADFFPAAKYRDHFYRPKVIDYILDTLDEAEALRLAEE